MTLYKIGDGINVIRGESRFGGAFGRIVSGPVGIGESISYEVKLNTGTIVKFSHSQLVRYSSDPTQPKEEITSPSCIRYASSQKKKSMTLTKSNL